MSIVRKRREHEAGKDWKVISDETGETLAECDIKKNAELFSYIHDRKQRNKVRRV